MTKTTQEIRDAAVETLLATCTNGLPSHRIDAARELLQLVNIEAERARWETTDGVRVELDPR